MTTPSMPRPEAERAGLFAERHWPALVFAAGVAYTLLLLSTVREGAFFSGDAGIKQLVVKQLAGGALGVHLELSAPDAVRKLWAQGMYPFTAPFVYEQDGRYLVSFPITFEALTAPLYRWFGFRGLYVLPTLSLWVLWAWFVKTLRGLALPPTSVALGLAALVFTTHLTSYAGTFWEHTLGTLLAFAGVDYFARRRSAPLGAVYALAAGLCAAATYLFRPEGLLLVALLCGLAVGIWLRERSGTSYWFVVGAALGLTGCFGLNVLLYAEPLGLHGRQVVSDVSAVQQLVGTLRRAAHIWLNLLLYTPLVLFAAVHGLWQRRRSRVDLTTPAALLLPCAAFLLLMPLLVPNNGGKQLGPRYTLVVIPALILCAIQLFRQPADNDRPRWLKTLFVACAALGLCVNTFTAWRLGSDYRTRVAPGLDLVRRASASLVLVDQTFAAQELAAAMPQKSFVLVDSPHETLQALAAARSMGQATALFASLVMYPPPRFPTSIKVEDHGERGTFHFYELSAP